MADRDERALPAGLTDQELKQGEKVDEIDPTPLASVKAAVKDGRDTVLTNIDTDESEDGYVPGLKEQP